LKNSEKCQGPLVSRSWRLNGLRRSPVRTHNTASSDVVVIARRRWPHPTWSWPYLHTASSKGRSPPLCLRSRARLPPLCSASLYHRVPVSASHLRPPPGPDAASPSSAFTPWCSSPSPPTPFLRELTDNRPPRAPISRPHSCLCQHHSAPEYSGTVSIPDFPHFSDPSPALPYADRHHRREPSSGEPPPRPTPQ
jgi:hypothetical protein